MLKYCNFFERVLKIIVKKKKKNYESKNIS